MNARTADEADNLIAHIRKHAPMLTEVRDEITAAFEHDIPLIGRTGRTAVLIAGLLENYCTCAETVFVRIARFFENNLSPDAWHKDLLERMSLEIDEVRPRVVSDDTQRELTELLRFRHFRRYYYGTAYDWERLEELTRRVARVHERLLHELEFFTEFIRALAHPDRSG
ncbi:MAG: hypothetical protein EA426_04200 [Spirochaetaceae bacterium]|nr:MAG: hypothetical protein EA426_04200 [Spirochaetaceae bacterium]